MLKIFSLIVTALFLSFGLLLGVLNPGTVSIDLFFWQTDMPLSILLVIAIIFGMLIAAFYFTTLIFQQRWRQAKLAKENKKLANEVVQLNKKMVEFESRTDTKNTDLVVTSD